MAVVGVLAGGGAAVLPYGLFTCALPLMGGVLVGAACSLFASTHRMWFGVVGNMLVVVTGILVARAYWQWGDVGPAPPGVWLTVFGFCLPLWTLPGLFGSFLIAWWKPAHLPPLQQPDAERR